MGRAKGCGDGGTVYFMGAIGAMVYYIGAADGFWQGVLGFLKGLIWPGLLVYEALRFLQP